LSGTVIKRGGKWVAVAELPRDVNGKRRKRWSSGHKTRKEAEAARVAMLHEIANGIDVAPSRLRLDAYLRRWLEATTARVAPRTAEQYQGVVKHRLIPTLGGIELVRLTPLHIEEALNKWRTDQRADGRDGVLSDRSVSLAFVVLKMALTQAVKWNLVPRNAATAVTPPRAGNRESTFVSAEDVSKLLAEAERSGMLAQVTAAIGLGLRRAELLGLQWQDVSLERASVSVSRTLQRINGVLLTKEPKTRQSRRAVVAPAFVLDALRTHRAAQAEMRLALGLGKAPENAFVFSNPEGGPLDPDAFGKRIKRLAKRAGLPDVHLHSLRHGFAVLSAQAGVDLKVISARMGHSSIRLTADTYAHVVESLQHDAADRLDTLVKGARSTT
jgi:integrase